MEFGKGGVLLSLGTPSGKGYWTLSVSFSISLSVCLPHGKTEGPGRWQGVNPWDISPKQIWRSTLDLHLAIALPTRIFHNSQLPLQPLEGLQLPRSGGSELLLEARNQDFRDSHGAKGKTAGEAGK